MLRLFLVACLLSVMTLSATAGAYVNEDILPPKLAWNGKSASLALPPDHSWATPFERSGLTDSPSYEETVAWLKRLTDAAPELEMISIGTSWEGREIYAVIASREQAFSPEKLKETGKPLILVQAGIHSGEIDGKDAGMMLLRDMTVLKSKRSLLKKANLFFIPILSVDAHERSSAYNRINQRGPKTLGWRTNGRNLNLNRDYSKLETPEIRALVQAVNVWEPDLYLDIHVTDGIDYQYDITFGYTGTQGHSPAISTWLSSTLKPALYRDLEAMGHTPGPLIFAVDGTDPAKGIVEWTAPPRFSHGYGDACHIPTMLVENHSLKPFSQRVFGTYVLLESTMEVMGRAYKDLRTAVQADRERRPDNITLTFKPPDVDPGTVAFKGVAYELVSSSISGGNVTRWLGKPEEMTIPLIRFTEPAEQVTRPAGYWLPPDWPEVIDTLALHGVRLERLETPRDVEVEMYRIFDAKLEESPLEGRVRVTGRPVLEERVEHLPKGSVWVSTDQPLCELIALLLEPASPDSFFQWGYFHEILQRTEYFESYAMEPLAQTMLEQDPSLKDAFEAWLHENEAHAEDARARLDWFYQKSPYVDARWRLFPIARAQTAPTGPLSPQIGR